MKNRLKNLKKKEKKKEKKKMKEATEIEKAKAKSKGDSSKTKKKQNLNVEKEESSGKRGEKKMEANKTNSDTGPAIQGMSKEELHNMIRSFTPGQENANLNSKRQETGGKEKMEGSNNQTVDKGKKQNVKNITQEHNDRPALSGDGGRIVNSTNESFKDLKQSHRSENNAQVIQQTNVSSLQNTEQVGQVSITGDSNKEYEEDQRKTAGEPMDIDDNVRQSSQNVSQTYADSLKCNDNTNNGAYTQSESVSGETQSLFGKLGGAVSGALSGAKSLLGFPTNKVRKC